MYFPVYNAAIFSSFFTDQNLTPNLNKKELRSCDENTVLEEGQMTQSDKDSLTLPVQLKTKTISCRSKRSLKRYIGLVIKILVIRPQFNHIRDPSIAHNNTIRNPIVRVRIPSMVLDGVTLTKINYRAMESAEQDQTARMCRLILLYSLLNINA